MSSSAAVSPPARDHDADPRPRGAGWRRRPDARHLHRRRPIGSRRRGRDGAALSPRDRILTNHRSAGSTCCARGADPGRLMAEISAAPTATAARQPEERLAARQREGKAWAWCGHLHHRRRLTLAGMPGVALAQKMGSAGTEAGGITAAGVLRRRRGLRGHPARVGESGRDLEAAAAVRLREQPVAGLRAPRRDHAQRAGARVGAKASRARASRWTATTSTPCAAPRLAAAEHACARRARPTSWNSSPTASAATTNPTTVRPTSTATNWRAGRARPDPHAARAPARRRRDRARRLPTSTSSAWPTPSRPRHASPRSPGPWPETASSPPTSTPDPAKARNTAASGRASRWSTTPSRRPSRRRCAAIHAC